MTLKLKTERFFAWLAPTVWGIGLVHSAWIHFWSIETYLWTILCLYGLRELSQVELKVLEAKVQ